MDSLAFLATFYDFSFVGHLNQIVPTVLKVLQRLIFGLVVTTTDSHVCGCGIESSAVEDFSKL